MKSLTLALLGATALFFACKKQPETLVYANYTNLKPGNYWVYDRYSLDTNGIYTPMGKSDSNYVEKDTQLNGQTYHKLMVSNNGSAGGYSPLFLRDSLHYLVNAVGEIRFSSENFTDKLGETYIVAGFSAIPDTIARISTAMTDDGQTTQTPAGAFPTKNFRETYTLWPKYTGYKNKRFLDHRYAENVGLVESTWGFFLADPSGKYIVQRLRKYGSH